MAWGFSKYEGGTEVTREWRPRHTGLLLAYAERAEDEVENVIGGRCARDFIKSAKGGIEIEQDHFVRDATVYGIGCCS